jgi:acyl-CoA thioesterase-2
MGDLAVDTAVEGRDGRYRARLAPDWEVWGPNGGYLGVIALRAAGASTCFARPATFACHYLSVAAFDEVDLAVTTLHAGRRATSLRVSMTQRARAVLEAVVWVVEAGLDGLEHTAADAPDVPGPEALPSTEELLAPAERSPYPFWQNLECRPIDWVPPRAWQPGPPTYRSWFRFRPRATFEDPFVDAGRALVLIDTMGWPAAWQHHGDVAPYVAPSLDVAVQFHRCGPRTPWLFCEATSPVAREGLVAGRAAVWSPDGHLVASGGGQLLCRRQRPLA